MWIVFPEINLPCTHMLITMSSSVLWLDWFSMFLYILIPGTENNTHYEIYLNIKNKLMGNIISDTLCLMILACNLMLHNHCIFCCSCQLGEIMSLSCSIPRWCMSMKGYGGMLLRGENQRTGKTCRITTLSTTNPTWSDPDGNPALHSERPATNHLNHGTASDCI
jgi:hypothetical protein